MSQQTQPRNRPGQQARPGDVTGRKREQLAAEHAEEIKAREGNLAMISAEKQRSMDEDIIDPLTREIIRSSDGTVTNMDDDEDEEPRVLRAPGGSLTIEEMPEPKPRLDPTGKPVQVNRDPEEKVVVRFNCDLEEVTIGHGNTFTFEQGKKYRLPRWVAEHFDEKGVLWH